MDVDCVYVVAMTTEFMLLPWLQSKVSKRSWVLHECMERVPDSLDAMRELLMYGCRGTDIEALITIGNKEDGGR